MDFISRDALISAMNAWALNKATVLSQILQDQVALTEARRGLLDALVEEHIRAHRGNPQNSLAALSSIGTFRDDLARIADPDIQASMPLISAAHANREGDPYRTVSPPSLGESSSTGARFRVLRPHAKGGLGQVSVAVDLELDRRVALKEIQDRHADDLHSRARFVQEAEITGKLEHPGIIPVYGLGHDASGRPFYAMRFIAGDSLGEAITAFHGDPELKRDLAARSCRLRELLRRFTDVCNAVAYAHSRGVLHRDLKPGNIMLGPYGETLLVDWGLAKAAGFELPDGLVGTHSPEPSTPIAEGPIRLSGQSGPPTDTVPGAPIGTPAFASPEQVTGAMDRLGPATDIYGLGATLYALLTGHAPVESADLMEVIRRVSKGEIPAPRSRDATVSKALDAVCRKAMAVLPENRYASARELAADVTRWLDDAPVLAFREPVSARTGRWIRRHPRLVSAAAAAVVVGLVTMGIAYSLESKINRQLRITGVKDQINAALERFEGSTKEVDFVAGKIDELARLEPAEVAPQRKSLGVHVVAAVAKMIHQERSLSPADVDRVKVALNRVKDFAPDSLSDLDTALRDRLSKFDPLFTLAGSFDGLAGVFDPSSVRFSGQGLVAVESVSGLSHRLIPSKVPSQGDVEIEGTFTLIHDMIPRPLVLAVEAEIRLNAIPEGGEPGLAELIDSGLEEISRLVQDGRFTPRQLMMMLSAWTGTAGFLGWAGLEGSLKDQRELRGKIAYVYGRRFLALKQPEVARRLFQLARGDSPAQSPFQKLSQDQLDKLGAK
jgi:serine/threonine protein kinase